MTVYTRTATPSAPLVGIMWALMASVAFVAVNVLVKHLGQKLPPLEMSLFRAAGGLLLVGFAWREMRQLRDKHIHGLRALIGAIGIFANVYAFTALPIGLAIAVLHLRAALMIAIARVFLGERASLGIWAAVGVAIGGAMVALYPKMGGTVQDWLGVAAILTGAVFSAGSLVCVRRLAATNSPQTIVVAFSVLTSAFIGAPAALTWVTPPMGDMALLFLIAAFIAVAQYCFARASQSASIAILSPLQFVEVPFAAVVGYVLFSEIPDAYTVAGAVLIIGACWRITVIANRDVE